MLGSLSFRGINTITTSQRSFVIGSWWDETALANVNLCVLMGLSPPWVALYGPKPWHGIPLTKIKSCRSMRDEALLLRSVFPVYTDRHLGFTDAKSTGLEKRNLYHIRFARRLVPALVLIWVQERSVNTVYSYCINPHQPFWVSDVQTHICSTPTAPLHLCNLIDTACPPLTCSKKCEQMNTVIL